MNIADLNNYYIMLWHHSGGEHLPFRSAYSSDEKKRREEYLKKKIRKMTGIKSSQIHDERYQDKLFSSAKKASSLLLNTSEENLGFVFSDEFKKSSRDFIQSARKFDKAISQSDISQAARNLWVINCLQVLFGYPVKMTPSAFAYSLLYPYCDNYLDDPGISRQEKHGFNSALGLCLKGEKSAPSNIHEEKIFRLISMIEEEFPRAEFPDVYKSLISIHNAQCKSMNLFNNSSLSNDNILLLSFEKGGASVLADGFLVCGNLSEFQIRFLYGLGIYLQVIDDLQDLKEDQKAELTTIFSSYSIVGNLDHLTNKTLNFGERIIKETEKFQNGSSFRELISESTNLLVIEAACLSQYAYSREYIIELERHSPFHFSFIKKYRKKYSASRIPFDEMLRAVPAGN